MPEKKRKILLLFNHIQAGNKQAFDELFLTYYDRLLAYAKQYISKTEIAEEITSELFVKIWLRRNDLSNILNPEVYLFISIKNACLNTIRSEKKQYLIFSGNPHGVPIEEIADIKSSRIEDQELTNLLKHAIAMLPHQRKLIFKLIKEEELTSSEVSVILDLSIRTVENQLYKAVKTLAANISDYLGYHPQRKIIKKKLFFVKDK